MSAQQHGTGQKSAPDVHRIGGTVEGSSFDYSGVTNFPAEAWPDLDQMNLPHNPERLSLTAAREAMNSILMDLPDLGRKGFIGECEDPGDFHFYRDGLMSDEGLAYFLMCVERLGRQAKRPTIDPGYSSNRCAHDIAAWYRREHGVSPPFESGHVIAAAHFLGIDKLHPPGFGLALLGIERLHEKPRLQSLRLATECTREAWAEYYGVDGDQVGEPDYEGVDAWFITETAWGTRCWERRSSDGIGHEINPWWPVENGRPPDGPIVPPPDDPDGEPAPTSTADTAPTAEPAEADIADDWSTLDAAIETMNRKYAAVSDNGDFQIFRMGHDPIFNRKKLERIAPASFRQMYANVPISVSVWKGGKEETVTKSAANWWLIDTRRRQYLEGVIFDPTGKAPRDFWNLWQGWPTPPRAGDWSLMRQHIRDVICSGDDRLDRYVMGWLARMVQHPDQPGEVALVLRGKKGCGKGTLGNILNKLLGQHGIRIGDPKHLVGNFNAHLRDAIFLFADEAFFAADRQHDGILKGLVTEPLIFVEAKGKDGVQCRNMLHILMASNSNYVVPATGDERRYAVIDVSSAKIGDFGYFAALQDQMAAGGGAAMLHDLLAYDISDFNHRSVPATSALDEQKLMSLDSLDKWLMAVLMRGYVWKSRHGADLFAGWMKFVTTQLLVRSYQQWCGENRVSYIKDESQLGQMMTRLFVKKRASGEHPIYEVDVIDREVPRPAMMKDHPNGYVLGDIEAARAKFSDALGVTIQWDSAEAA